MKLENQKQCFPLIIFNYKYLLYIYLYYIKYYFKFISMHPLMMSLENNVNIHNVLESPY